MRRILLLLLFCWVLLAGSEGFARTAFSRSKDALAALEIDRIDILGVTLFQQKELERLLEVSPGDPLDRPAVLKTEANIQGFYRRRGYEEAGIQSRLVRQRAPGAGQELETVLE